MPTTPNYAFPYPTATDTADVPRDIQALATPVDTTIKTIDTKVSGLLFTIAGKVNGGTGAIMAGTGFTAVRAGLGDYTVTITVPGFTLIAPVVTPHIFAVVLTPAARLTTTAFGVVAASTAGANQDTNFAFVAVGTKP
jgi:hypothetical protein